MLYEESSTEVSGDVLVNTYVRTRHPRDKEKAVKAYLNLVKHIIGRMNIPTHVGIRKEDLYQFGIIGLLNSLERFHPEYGVSFKTFAYRRIQGEVIDAIRKEGGLSREQIKMQKRISQASDSLRYSLKREPTIEEICVEAGIEFTDYYFIEQKNNLNFTISLDGRLSGNDEEKLTPKDIIVDESQIPPDKEIDIKGIKDDLKQLLTELPERERLILVLYYYEELTLFDIGQVLDISESRVSQLMNQTLAYVKSQLKF